MALRPFSAIRNTLDRGFFGSARSPVRGARRGDVLFMPVRSACGGRVHVNYDHVGNCATGACSGTFVHEHFRTRTCVLSKRDVGHGAVTRTSGDS